MRSNRVRPWVLVAVLLVVGSGSPAWAGNLLFMDRFNDGLGAWALDQTGGTVTISTVTNSTKMVLEDTSGAAVVSATRSFTEPGERYNLEFDGYYGSGASLSAQLLDANDNAIITIELTGGSMNCATDTTPAATSPWPAVVYKQVTLAIDPVGQTVRCYLTQTGSARVEDEQVPVGTAQPYSGTRIAKLRFITGASATGTGRVDEVRMYRPNVFVMGDSVAAGKLLWANDPGNVAYRQQIGNLETSPPSYQLGLLLNDGGEWVANRGFGGASISEVCDRLPRMALDQGAQRLILHVGHNDLYRGRTLGEMQADLADCVSALFSAGLSGNRVTLSNVLPSGLSAAGDAKRREYNKHLLAVCAAHGYTCVDPSSLLGDPSDPTRLHPTYNGGDATHLSPAGSGALAQSWVTDQAGAPAVWPQPILTPVVGGLSDPVHIANAGDGSGRLFIVERAGRIRIYQNGGLLNTPFLDISSKTSTGGERGLLSVAFPPAYETNGRFYVFYTQASGGDLVIARYRVTADPNVADPLSEQILLLIEHSSANNHNGGQLAFSPMDGYLYISTGDGGNTPAEAQNLGSLLGKLLRINVEVGAPSLYTIPGNNPFVGTAGARGEIWALGLRNPWRFAFDRTTADLYLADVGQASWEEVNAQAATSTGGQNYGWNLMEGVHCYPSGTCNPPGLTPPVLEYASTGADCAIMGGVVYRGTAYPRMQGIYFYADYCSGKIWGLQRDGSAWSSMLLTTYNVFGALTSFGEGEDGSIYFTDSSGNAIYQIVDSLTTADLGVTIASVPTATVGQAVAQTLTVRNDGPSLATGVSLDGAWSTGTMIGAVTASQGTCTTTGLTIACGLGVLADNATAEVTIEVTPTVIGTLITQTTVSADQSDPQLGNNVLQHQTSVTPTDPPPSGSDLSVTQLATPDPSVVGSAVTYTVVVANNGPETATGVIVVDTLPPGATLVSAVVSQGACSGTGPVTCAIGGVAAGSGATATIVVTLQTAGTVSNGVQVTGDQSDPVAGNNSASTAITVAVPSAHLTLAPGPQLPGGAEAAPGDTNVPMSQFSFATGAEGVILDAVMLAASGNGNEATDVQAVHMVLDANGNGTVDPGEPVLGSGAFTADDGAITIALTSPRAIPGSSSETYLIVYDFSLVRSAAVPASAGLMVLALAGALRAPGLRRYVVLLIGVAGLCLITACSNEEGPDGNSSVNPTTYQIALTGVAAEEQSSGGAVTLSGFPLVGPVMTVR